MLMESTNDATVSEAANEGDTENVSDYDNQNNGDGDNENDSALLNFDAYSPEHNLEESIPSIQFKCRFFGFLLSIFIVMYVIGLRI